MYLAALDFEIPAELRKGLNEASKLDLVHPYMFFEPFTQARINGGVVVQKWGC